MKYLVIVEKTKTGFSAYSPEIDGCVATGNTKQEVENNMKEAIDFHLEGIALEYQKSPKSYSYSNYPGIIPAGNFQYSTQN